MKINISGNKISIGSSLKEYIEERINKTSEKYLNTITWTDIIVSKENHLFLASIVMHEGAIGTIKGTGENDDVYSAFDLALIRIEKQLRKYKDKILTRNKKKAKDELSIEKPLIGTKYILSGKEDIATEQNHEPITIAEKSTNIETLTVSEAIMKMDLAHLPALLFKNKANGRLNVVYHRADGNISWVDPGG